MGPSYPMAAITIRGAASLELATGVGTIVARAGFPLSAGDRRIGWIDGLRGNLALAVLIHGFFSVAVACGNDLRGLLSTSGALVPGACSFGIYLLPGVILSLVFVEGESALRAVATEHLSWRLPPIAIVVAVLAPLVYLAIEGPAIEAGRRIAARLSERRPQAGEAELNIAP